MASVLDSTSSKEDQRRPHLCVATWGTTIKGFKCVIESLSTKYTMFSAAGAPLRATCTVKLKEADVVSKAADTPSGTAAPGTASKTGK
jgi:phage protein U